MKGPNGYKPKSYRLREMPKDVYDLIIDEQAKKKKSCNCQFSIESTIYMMLRRAGKVTEEQSDK
jgi:hypothetical protein